MIYSQAPHPPAILSIGTAVPPYRVEQAAVGQWMSEAFNNDRAMTRWIRSLYKLSGVETRYTCLPDGLRPPEESRFAPGRDPHDTPSTAERMEVYKRESVQVGKEAAYEAITNYSEISGDNIATVTDSITHLLTVSCTGFFAPGLDQMIARQLNLQPSVERTIIGFMGCAAAFNALRLANQIVQAQPSARVLIVCVELCTLHIQPSKKRADLVSAAIFADGGGACLVGIPEAGQSDIFELGGFYTELTPETESFMVWDIGNNGFTLHLASDIPGSLGQVAPRALQELFHNDPPDLQFWAIHPGGRAIVDHLTDIFALAPDQIAPSRTVLRDYGNVSSPTILFVLQEYRKRLRQYPVGSRVDGVAMAFGPGLVTELAHLTYLVSDMQSDADDRKEAHVKSVS
ncbi:MAG: type III polyketide synthase [Chloroflexi bacterium AL-W]|nr:type III polyketide synthase [Chloroflexi bacterium AL-N1]NOK64808.1 type III polyketide synthase [Chloroflexi bacterium AL-N10]NOK76578.1 type III polyketide synthase [Chloroflexi bacterium AL-N5]NOK80192.1 type III polyketide synthase [Chloroflexi bacterium AL-W]NOK86705.1 type III polyketide synthase [Chloroflexi bacterium AL-N15]